MHIFLFNYLYRLLISKDVNVFQPSVCYVSSPRRPSSCIILIVFSSAFTSPIKPTLPLPKGAKATALLSLNIYKLCSSLTPVRYTALTEFEVGRLSKVLRGTDVHLLFSLVSDLS